MQETFPLYEQQQIVAALSSQIRILENHYQTLVATNPQLVRLLEYLEQHYTEKISLQDVCQYMCMTSKTLNRFLHKETSRSFIALLQQIRIRHAVELLETTTDTVTGIGYSVGFESAKSFCKIFKREMGITPKEFRIERLSKSAYRMS